MSNEVYANNNEISCKAGAGKVIACFPDVCLSPPTPPAGPVPIPYPVSSFSSDATDGSKSVQINGKEIMLKDKSYFSKCTGDEAATKSLGMGVVSHNISGKVYYAAWSMDVKFEGMNVDRHLDLTTSNHMSPPGNTVTMVEVEGMSVPADVEPCKCKYKRPDGSPTEDQKDHVNDPAIQGDPVLCWICHRPAPSGTRMVADHQPSLAERWYTNEGGSGCKDKDKFEKDSKSTPDKNGQGEYKSMKPRCMICLMKQPSETTGGTKLTSNIVGREGEIPEMSYESMKSRRLRQLSAQKAHGVEPKDCS